MECKSTDATIKDFTVSEYIVNEGKTISIDNVSYFGSVTYEDALIANLYDENHQLISTATGYSSDVSFNGLPNEDKVYIIEFGIPNVSDTRIITFKTNKSKIAPRVAYIIDTEINNGISGKTLSLLVKVPGGDTRTVTMSSRFLFNYELFTGTLEEFAAIMDATKLIEYGLNSLGYVIKITSEPIEKYTNLTYNLSTMKFNNVSINENLTILYFNGESGQFMDPYLNEGYLYDISVFSSCVLITAMRSTTPYAVIQGFDTDVYDGFFNKSIRISSVYYLGDVSGNLTAKLYDENNNLIDTVFGNTTSIRFDNLPNKNKTYIIEFYVEGQTDKRTITVDTKKTEGNTPWCDFYFSSIEQKDQSIQYNYVIQAVNGDIKNQKQITPVLAVYDKNGNLIVVKKYPADTLNDEYETEGSFLIPDNIGEFNIRVFYLKDFGNVSPLKIIK